MQNSTRKRELNAEIRAFETRRLRIYHLRIKQDEALRYLNLSLTSARRVQFAADSASSPGARSSPAGCQRTQTSCQNRHCEAKSNPDSRCTAGSPRRASPPLAMTDAAISAARQAAWAATRSMRHRRPYPPGKQQPWRLHPPAAACLPERWCEASSCFVLFSVTLTTQRVAFRSTAVRIR